MIGFTIREQGPTPKLAMRQLNAIQREVGHELGDFWHRDLRPKHFTHAGATEYGYKRRTIPYEKVKLRRYGHTYPLVYSGESKNATRLRDVRVTATKNEAKIRIVLHSPKLNFIPKGGRINLRQEMAIISAREGRQLAHIAGVQQARRFREIKESTSKI